MSQAINRAKLKYYTGRAEAFEEVLKKLDLMTCRCGLHTRLRAEVQVLAWGAQHEVRLQRSRTTKGKKGKGMDDYVMVDLLPSSAPGVIPIECSFWAPDDMPPPDHDVDRNMPDDA